MKRNIIVLTLLIIIAAVSRFIPHGYNFTPIAGMALLGGAYFKKKYLAILVPIAVLFVTDVMLNNTLYRAFFPDHEGFVLFSDFMIYTYLGTALMVVVGMGLLHKITAPRLLGSVLFSTIIFFLVTNFGSWIANPVYPQNLGGLMASYVAGLPFLSGHLIGNLVYTFILFGAYELIVHREINVLARLS
ncbi:DUF6580 family putative transport protein [Portibacter marinus]|uniref:DUF6580 family putative transport protein n=1 Tax=Portibacter marinus TaxID=2898660 RepID=UPI001F21FDE3|nr:DUF6580 family putative transport protein [Portibacter marinus]